MGLSVFAHSASCPMVLAYYTSWNKGVANSGNLPYTKLTHICHAFCWPNPDGTINAPAGYLEPALISNAHANGVKVLASLGGATQSGNFAALCANAGSRATLVANIKAFILANGYDGADVDWEFPQNATDRTGYTLLIQELRAAFNAAPNAHPEWLISSATSWTTWYAQYLNLGVVQASMSFINVMTYDAHGSWSNHSGHVAPLNAASGDSDSASMVAAINYYQAQGVPSSKLVFGLAYYGYSFPAAGLHQACSGGCAGTTTYAYSAIPGLISSGWTRTWDASASSPYLRNPAGNQVLSYDDPQSVQAKADWALNTKGLAGVFMWDISLDVVSGTHPLLDAMRAPLNCGTPTPTPTFSATLTPVIFPVPGRVQAEDYSAAQDSTPGNAGAAYRGGDADIEATTDTGLGYNLGWTDAGEWTEYKINVGAAGAYEFNFRAASQNTTPMTLQVLLDGAVLINSVTILGTTGWQIWGDNRVGGVSLPAGLHTLRVVMTTGGYNLNYLDILSQGTPSRTPTRSATRSSTPSPSPSASPSQTRTASGTMSATRTPTASASPSSSATRSATRTITETWTAVPPGSTETATPTDSPSETDTETSTPSPTSTATATLSSSPSDSPTPSASPSVSGTFSPLPSASSSATSSASPTLTPSPSASSTPSATPSATPSFSPGASASPTSSASPTPSPSASAALGIGEFKIEKAWPCPNPNPSSLRVLLPGGAEKVQIRFYTRAFALRAVLDFGVQAPGWADLPLGSTVVGQSNGVCHYSVHAWNRAGLGAKPSKGTLFLSQ